MSDPVKLGPFLGINNKLPPEKLVVPAKQGQPAGAFVRDAVNVDLTAAGTFQRRGGATKLLSSTRANSLWGNGAKGYFVDAGTLMSFDGISATAIKTIPNPGATVSFTDTPRGVIWSDGVALELIAGNTSGLVNPPNPNPVPAVAASTGGSLTAGTYLVAFANVDTLGVRSAVSLFQAVTVTTGGAITITSPASPYDVQVFVSAVNGTQLFHEVTIGAGVTAATVSMVTSQGTPISNEYEDAMPPGVFVRLYRGRLLTVRGDTIFYSHTYNFGVTYPDRNFIRLDGPVTLCEPTQTGVFVATADSTWFLDGPDVATAELKPIAPYGAIPNTAVSEPNNLNMWWMTPRGLVHTNDGNTLDMKQDEFIAFGSATVGAALFREENGLSQVISALSNATPTGAASASSFMEATTVN